MMMNRNYVIVSKMSLNYFKIFKANLSDSGPHINRFPLPAKGDEYDKNKIVTPRVIPAKAGIHFVFWNAAFRQAGEFAMLLLHKGLYF